MEENTQQIAKQKKNSHSYKQKILTKLLFEEEMKAEKLLNRSLLFAVLPACWCLSIIYFIFDNFSYNSKGMLIILIIDTLYVFVIFIVLRKKGYKPIIKYITMFIDITLITFLLFSFSKQNGWVYSLRCMLVATYFFCILLSGIYQNPVLPLYSGALVIIQYCSLVLFALLFKHVEMGTLETFSSSRYSLDVFIFYNFLFITFAFTIFFLNKRYRQMLIRSLDSEAYSEVIRRTHKQKTRFFINLAHEAKTPLTLISNYMDEYMQNHGQSSELQIIHFNIEKLKQDMLNFLDYEKLERNQFFYNHNKIVHLSNVLSMQAILFKELAAQKGLELVSEITPEIYIRIDPNALERIINNLIENAIKYTEAPGTIKIVLRSDETMAVFSVADTGIGIPATQQKNIFKPFYQLSHKKSNLQGIGMGLNLIKKIITGVDARIQLESTPGIGTTFSVYFKQLSPLESEEVIDEYKFSVLPTGYKEIMLPEEVHQDIKPNLLIVEDNKMMLNYMHSKLKHEFNVFFALNGKEALEKITKIPKPDIILSDIMMDTMDGFAFHDQLRKEKQYHAVPFIYITALTSHEAKIKGLKKGAIDFIRKPFHIDELMEKLNSLICIKQALSQKNIHTLSDQLYDHLSVEKSKKIADLKDSINGTIQKSEALLKEYGISRREVQIVALLMAGLERKEISNRLGISINTVSTHIMRIFKKCKVNNRVELINILTQANRGELSEKAENNSL